MFNKLTSDFYKSSIVGYTTKSLEADKWYLVGCNFEQVGEGTLSIQDVATGLTPGSDVSDSPMIEYWDGTQLQILIYIDGGAWDEEIGDFVTAWADPAVLDAVKIPVTPGFGFWIKTPNAQVVTFAGQVVSADDVTKDIASSFDLISNPYPVSFAFNDEAFDCSNLTAGSDVSDSPMIEYWDGTQLQILIYIDGGAWDEEVGDFVTAWADPAVLDAVKIQNDVGTGFWVKAAAGSSNQKIKFVK